MARMLSIKKIIPLFALGLILSSSSQQHTPTWTDGIACIIHSHCSPCHNDKGIAPFPLLSYQEVYLNRFSIAASVQAGSMPPFPPSQERVQYAHDNTLSDHEIDEILEWVDNFAPYGDPNNDPGQPVYDDQYELDDPDVILKIPEYEVNTASDLYRVFVLPVNNSTEKYIKTIEIYPGNRDIVHHVLAFQDPSNIPAQLDANDPGPGYSNFGGTGSPNSNLMTGYVPGQRAFSYAEGMGVVLEANTNILLQIHYPGGVFGEKDSTEIRIKYSDTPLRNVLTIPALNHSSSLINGPLFIPADTRPTFYSRANIGQELTVTGVLPHMHLVGESIKAYSVVPSGDTIHLIDIPKWDFHWQGIYQFERPIRIPAGSVLYGEATYNNTSSNLYNPNNPPKDVRLGEGTEDEMMLIYFNFTEYQPGDEQIIIDTGDNFVYHPSCDELTYINDYDEDLALRVYPNPVSKLLKIEGLQDYRSISIFNSNGSRIPANKYDVLEEGINVEALMNGLYIIRIQQSDFSTLHGKFTINRT